MANQHDSSKNHNPQGHNQHTQGKPSTSTNRGTAQGETRQQDQSTGSASRNPSGSGTQGGTHEQHVKAGQQSHKNR